MADLYNPYEHLTEWEQAQYDAIMERSLQEGLTDGQKAAGVAAAFLFYRQYMKTRLTALPKTQPTRADFIRAIGKTYKGVQSDFKKLLLSYAVSSVAEAMAEVGVYGDERVMYAVAESYSVRTSDYLHRMSAEAVINSFQKQLNAGVPPQVAAQRAVNAFGVPEHGMNTLVASWTRDKSTDPRVVSAVVQGSGWSKNDERIVANHILNRARVIGANESQVLLNDSKTVVWKLGQSLGVIEETAERRWVTAEDELVCPYCGPMHMKRQGIGEKFTLPGGRKVWGPPVHPNCRCTLSLDVESFKRRARKKLKKMASPARNVEPVFKALGADPYDRDRSGRFSSSESRLKSRAGAPRMQTATRVPKPQTSVKLATEMDSELKVLLASVPDLAPPDLSSTTAAPDLFATSSATPDLASTVAPDLSAVLAPDLASTVAPDIAGTVAPDLTQTAAPTPEEPKEPEPEEEKPGVQPQDRPVAMVVYPIDNFDDRGLFEHGATSGIETGTRMYFDVNDDGGSEEIEYDLQGYWDNVVEEVMSSWEITPDDRHVVYDEETHNDYIVDNDALRDAMYRYIVSGGDLSSLKHRSIALSSVDSLDGGSTGEDRLFTAEEILTATDIGNELEDARPTVFLTKALPEDLMPAFQDRVGFVTHRQSRWTYDGKMTEGSGNNGPVARTVWIRPDED